MLKWLCLQPRAGRTDRMKKSLIKLVIVAVLIAVAAFLALNGLHIPGKSSYLKPVGEAISLGLDLRGGVSTEYIATDTSMDNYESLLEGTVSALRTRLTNAGFTEANVAVQQCAIGCIKMIVQATGDTTISEMTKDGKTRFTSKAKDLIKKLTGNDADGDGGGDDNGSGNQSPEEGGEVTAPQISGNTPFTDSTQVTIQGPQGAHIYYTTNGSTPTQESQLYSEPLTLSQTATIKAIAVVEGVSSEVASKAFTKSSGGGGDNGSGLDMG